MSSGPIEAGTALVRVPRRWVLSLGGALAADAAFRAAVLERGEESSASSLPPEALLACYLLLEAWKVEERGKRRITKSSSSGGGGGNETEEEEERTLLPLPQWQPSSRWATYIRALPRSYPLLMQTVSNSNSPLESDSVSLLFSGIPAAQGAPEEARAEATGAVAEAAAALVAAAASKSCGGEGSCCCGSSSSAAFLSSLAFARERFPWARASVRSRAMFLSDDDDKTNFKTSSASPSLPLPSFASAVALLPFGDLFNHAHAPPPEEPDTGGSCACCRGWHGAPGVCCENGERGEERKEAFAAAATAAAMAATRATAEAEPLPPSSAAPVLSNSWGDGAFDAAASEFVVSARRSYRVAGQGKEKVGEKEEGEKEGKEEEEGEEEKEEEEEEAKKKAQSTTRKGGGGGGEAQLFLTYSSGGADADNLATLVKFNQLPRPWQPARQGSAFSVGVEGGRGGEPEGPAGGGEGGATATALLPLPRLLPRSCGGAPRPSRCSSCPVLRPKSIFSSKRTRGSTR